MKLIEDSVKQNRGNMFHDSTANVELTREELQIIFLCVKSFVRDHEGLSSFKNQYKKVLEDLEVVQDDFQERIITGL